jgi:hypothetical protein
MKKSLAILLFLSAHFTYAQQWKIVPGKISSPWAEKVNPANTLPDYPRPQLVRTNWTNLNGRITLFCQKQSKVFLQHHKEIFLFRLLLNHHYPALEKQLEKTACFGINEQYRSRQQKIKMYCYTLVLWIGSALSL